MNKVLKNISVAGLADVLGLFGVPTATASAIYAGILEKRKSDALEILFSELRQGNFENIDQYELISAIARFQRDAMEGIAKNNLHLLARTICGMGNKKALVASSFHKYADALSSLTVDEIVVLGCMASTEHGSSYSCRGVLEEKYPNERWNMILQSLLRTGLIYYHQEISSEYKEPDYKEAIHGRGIEVNTDLSTDYYFTPLMRDILKYVDLIIYCQETKNADAARA
jgi:hypothetical protein